MNSYQADAWTTCQSLTTGFSGALPIAFVKVDCYADNYKGDNCYDVE